MSNKETLGFETKTKQMLHLMIHSLYGNSEIFLRELVSNSSDALDKVRFQGYEDPSVLGDDTELKISITLDEEAQTVTISDNGIGMDREEVVTNLGTIAHSGTGEFSESLTEEQLEDNSLIGQFGVGFYSSFVVADHVTVITRKAGASADEATEWQSDGEGEYTVEQTNKPTRGTDVILHLREDQGEFASFYRIETIIKKYSDHISFPIYMTRPAMPSYNEEGEEEPVTEEPSPEVINKAKAFWTRPKSDITDEEYDEFYQHISHDFEPPMARVHSRVEGTQEYTSLFYIPSRPPFDMWDRSNQKGVKLYVQRVFIMDDAENLLPPYLRFVKGIIDSSDLPLNVSREILQSNKLIDSMRAGSTKKVLGLLEDIAKDDEEKYLDFWANFGRVLKEGLVEDMANRDTIAKLMRFSTTHDNASDPKITLADYIGRMKEGQEHIYFITADSHLAAQNSPHLEIFRKKGIEVLLLSDPIDEWLTDSLQEFEGKSLQSVTKGELELGDLDDEASDDESNDESVDALVEKFTDVLGDRVESVRVTKRLTDSPACLVTGQFAMSANLERMLMNSGQDVQAAKPIMEINAEHKLVSQLADIEDKTQLEDWVLLIFEQAMLSEGATLDDPATFVKRVNRMLEA